jgi:MYXO-CTERM domain-containing protein
MRIKNSVVAMALVVGGLAVAAQADAILTFGFTDLSGSFNTGTAAYSAVGVNNAGGLQTQGDVTRLLTPGNGTATYLTGQAAGRVAVNLAITNILPTSATGNGTITITDADGDTLSATVSGNFMQSGVAVFFNGLLSNPTFTDNGVVDATFDGPGGGSFTRSFSPAVPPITGALVQLYMGNGANLFSSSFSGISTQINGAFVPTPGALMLAGLGGLAAARRRRQR